MYKIFGNKLDFAVEVDISTKKWESRTLLWLKGEKLGDWEDKNLIAPFFGSLKRLAVSYNKLWLDELAGLSCLETFLKINPFYIDPNRFYDLSESEQESLVRFDKFILDWEENFNNWDINSVYCDNGIKFLWIWRKHEYVERSRYLNELQFHNVKLEIIQDIYTSLSFLIPKVYE